MIVVGTAPARCSTPFGINEWITTMVITFRAVAGMCSTPFGINEWITRFGRPSCGPVQSGAQRLSASTNGSLYDHLCRMRRRRHVLNAFRHQRMDHVHMVPSVVGIEAECSTPFGINEWITLNTPSDTTLASECSTPFGINEWITTMPSCSSVLIDTCSTPFGINEWITTGIPNARQH